MTQVVNINKVQTITSLEIAELTGKQHFHLMRDIRKMEIAWEKVTQSKFGCSTYKSSNCLTMMGQSASGLLAFHSSAALFNASQV